MINNLGATFENLFPTISGNSLEIIFSIFCASFFGLILRLALGVSKQNWVKTYHNTLTFILLPPITFVITSLISTT